ncbi:MAG TPA: hypothetical protein VLH08_22875 [Acidobacteriota bacterium]|nr:hypothetical protein [Acidobacteriota bacterium]
MWSSVTIPGSPRILVADATQNAQGWEHEFANRLYRSLQKTGLQMVGSVPLFLNESEDLNALQSEFNCLLLFTHSDFLREQQELPSCLLAVCATESVDPKISELLLKSNPPVVPFAIVPQSEMTAREAGLFYLKFFTELQLHSKDSISGKMVWFSFSKARELLKRRRYHAKFSVRC